MKKILCITLMALLAVSAAYAQDAQDAADKPGPWGLVVRGIHIDSNSDQLQWSPQIGVRMAPQPIGFEVAIGQNSYYTEETGQTYNDDWGATSWDLQGKFLWRLVDRPNSDFYVGGMLGLVYYDYEYNNNDTTPYTYTDEEISFIFGVLAGAEWRLANIPSIGIMVEVGYNFEVETEESGISTKTGEDTFFAGTYASAGAAYYF